MEHVVTRPTVIIVGAGFGGLQAIKGLTNKAVDVLIIDRHNYHTFLPLLYQVATAGLEPEQVAAPVRGIVRHATNVNFLLGNVTRINAPTCEVVVETNGTEQTLRYDYLILSPGSTTNFFGMTAAEQHTFGLKSLNEAIKLRNHVLSLFERAAEADPEVRAPFMTMVVVGGGPTGLELSGALSELFRHVLRHDFPQLDVAKARVILVEATDRILAAYPPPLQQSALRQLRALGVEVWLNKAVADITADRVTMKDGTSIETYTVIWAAGVKAEEIGGLDIPRQRAQRLETLPTLQLAQYPQIYVIGDGSYVPTATADGKPYPQLAPVAMQQGKMAAANILAADAGLPQQPFRYSDRGTMATIGRSKAVAWVFNRVMLSGFLAWLSWLGLHLLYLVGFRNRTNVLINWMWNWVTWERGVRLILKEE